MSELKKYYKLTVKDENHHGFVYQDGLNVDTVPFDKTGSCCAGGLYFSDTENIMRFFDGDMRWIREITIPKGENDFVKDPSNNPPKWRSHSVVCGPRKDLNKVSTWKWMVSEGIAMSYANVLTNGTYHRNVKILKLLLSLPNVKFTHDTYCWALMLANKSITQLLKKFKTSNII